jgi:hypothetical protein
MRLRTLLLMLVLAAIVAFAAINWNAFMAPTNLSLGFTAVQAPLGVILLGLMALLTALFLLILVSLQTSALLGARRHARELQAQRELADDAEASRLTELRAFLDVELRKLAERGDESKATLLERLDQLHRDLRSVFEQSVNTLAAYIGELDDRLERETGEREPNAPA